MTQLNISRPPSSYQPKEIEHVVRTKWLESDVRAKIENKLRGKKKLGYVEGPPTLNGEPHVGHFRGRMMKDLWYRFETMRGANIDFRGGWDCQGLPVELQAEKELGLTGNKTANLKLIGEEKLVEICKKMLGKYHKAWTEMDELLGLLINDKKAYWTYHDEYIEREWQILRSAWKNRILDEGFRVTPFCPSCQTSLSAGEVALGGYETLEDPSMYFKMKLRGAEPGSYIITWTTMPFTVITDELIGAKPDSEYCYVAVGSETWLLGSERLDALMKELRIEKYQVKRRLKGRALEGLRYEYPLSDLIPKQRELEIENPKVHSVVAEEFVETTTGSGFVHMSPANGEDDFEIARKRGLPVFNPVDDQAAFTRDAGRFSGLFVRDADQLVANSLREKGLLLRYGKLKHEYPVCWRSGHRLLWLARRGYYYFVDRLNDMAVVAASDVQYYYDQPRNRFLEIIREKRPWCISRERVWGAPLPIWKCNSCQEKLGLFSRKEIIQHARSLPEGENFELHRPWIDRVVIECPKCKREMKREPFVLDTWHNSGASPYASLTDSEYNDYVPVPFATEGIDQTRGWAYTLLIESVIFEMRARSPYRAFLFQGLVLDAEGQKMSKSKGNSLAARTILENNSVDLARLYVAWKAGPIDSINFDLKELTARPYQILNTLYHIHLFYLQNSRFDGFSLSSKQASKALKEVFYSLRKQDQWILSRVAFLSSLCGSSYSNAQYHDVARAIEEFLIVDLSQNYIPIVRSELWEESEEGRNRREAIYVVLGFALLTCNKLLHPIAPYLTDYLAMESFEVEFLILDDWPSPTPEFRNEKIEQEFDLLGKAVSLTNAARMKAKLKRRWPLRKAFYFVSEEAKELLLVNKEILLDQTNLEQIEVVHDFARMPVSMCVKLNPDSVAFRAKERAEKVSQRLTRTDAAELYRNIAQKGKTRLPGLPDFELGGEDLSFTFDSKDSKYVVSEDYGIVVALDSSRDEELIFRGLLRDVARNLQALRKEKGYNPTDLLELALVAGLEEPYLSMLKQRNKELAFLVRAKEVRVYSESPLDASNWREVEIDGANVKLEIT